MIPLSDFKPKSPSKKHRALPKSINDFYAPFSNPNPLKISHISDSKFEIDERYEILDIIGKGAYGIVVAARDLLAPLDKQLIAIKKIEKAFEHKLFTKRTLRELRILRLLRHDNVASINTLQLPKSRESFDDLYVVYDLMETDLFNIIRSPQQLNEQHTQFFIYQILRGLKFIHSANILHRDLKSRNLLVNSNSDLKICDFGLSRFIIPGLKQSSKVMTNYVATRWYRAPELLLKSKEYSFPIDMWSVGCIFAEILKRKPFLPGTDSKNQLELIFELLGTPTDEQINAFPAPGTQKFLKSLKKQPSKKLESLFPDVSPIGLDLLKKMLSFDQNKRITVEQALDHPFLEYLHCEEDEIIRKPVEMADFEFEQYNLTIEQLKDMIYEEILLYHFPSQMKEYDQRKKAGKSIIDHILLAETNKLDMIGSDNEYEGIDEEDDNDDWDD